MLARNIRIEEDLIDLARPQGQQLVAHRRPARLTDGDGSKRRFASGY
jgi:hypothetical protein